MVNAEDDFGDAVILALPSRRLTMEPCIVAADVFSDNYFCRSRQLELPVWVPLAAMMP